MYLNLPFHLDQWGWDLKKKRGKLVHHLHINIMFSDLGDANERRVGLPCQMYSVIRGIPCDATQVYSPVSFCYPGHKSKP